MQIYSPEKENVMISVHIDEQYGETQENAAPEPLPP